MKYFFTVPLLLFTFLLHAQLNTTLLANLKYNVRLNDVWGWVAPDGTEYALVGVLNGISIVSLANPSNPKEVAFVPGGNSTWRDLKTWGNFAYVTTDQSGTREGLVAIDLSRLPDTVTYSNWTPTIDQRTLYTCHNLYIEEGVAYLAGCNVNGGGILFVDVKNNPGNPVLVGRGPNIYAHDVYTRNDTMYTSEIYAGEIGFYNISDKNNPIQLTKQSTPFRFTHNTWLSDNSGVIFSTDEQPNAPVAAYDIKDLDNVKELDQFRPLKTLGLGVIPHNVHVKNDYLLISYYTDGGVFVDASRPDNLIEVANYDTYRGADGGFSGAWGVYPFLPSGIILISDINTGLWVVKPNLQRACYLEGVVTDSITGQPIAGVQVNISSAQTNREETNLNGIYKTGQVQAGTFTVSFIKENYYPKKVEVSLQNGVLTPLDVKLVSYQNYAITGKVIVQNQNAGVAGANIMLENDLNYYIAKADAAGNFNLNPIVVGNYNVYVGAWGYYYKKEMNIVIDGNKTITLSLLPGYEDNFLLDLGWESISTATTSGIWERSIPVATVFNGKTANPGADLPNDLGDFCYMTGNDGGNANNDDVDGGSVILMSPPMNLTNYNNPVLNYQLWFFNESGAIVSSSDSLLVRVSNGIDTVTVEKLVDSKSEWRSKSSIQLRDFIQITNNMKVLFITSDTGASSNIVEAAVDGFSVEDKVGTPVEEPALQRFMIKAYPNPFDNQVTIQMDMAEAPFMGTLRILNALGQVIKIIPMNKADNQTITLEAPFASGIYWLQALSADGNKSEVVKLIKW